MFKLLMQYKRNGEWIEIMTGTMDEIYKWIDKHPEGYNSKIIKK